jgi:hypothetical protein
MLPRDPRASCPENDGDPITPAHHAAYVAARSALRALDVGAPSRPIGRRYRDVLTLLDQMHPGEGSHVRVIDQVPRREQAAQARTAIAQLAEHGVYTMAVDAALAAFADAVDAEFPEWGSR